MSFLTTFDQRRLLVLDLDGMISEKTEAELAELQTRLKEVADSLILVYVSGGSLQEEMTLVRKHHLLTPDYVVSAVGTEIHRLPGEHPLDEWYRYIHPSFDRDEIAAFIEDHYLSGNGLKLSVQPTKNQTPLKISYFWRNASPQALEAMQQALIGQGFPARLIYSHQNYLDIIPERAGMGASVKFLVDSLVLFPNQVYVCGDSGNDIDLFQYGYRGIVVGNASRELLEAVKLRAYFSHKPYAAGVLEGLNYYNFFQRVKAQQKKDVAREAFDRARESLRLNLTPMGFSAASLTDNPLTDTESNYFAVWSRDGIKSGLWALCLNDNDVTQCFRQTLELMAENQTPSGQIPSNVQIKTGKPDYGGVGDIASIDSVIWFVIGGCRYAAHTGDLAFLRQIYPSLALAMQWLRAHDSNNNGLLELPESSDWMDLFPRSYNVLYGEVLWYLACKDFSVATAVVGDPALSQSYRELGQTVHQKIVRQFWPTAKKVSESQVAFSEKQFTLGDAQYLLAQISPFDFSWRCDVYANLLAALTGLLDAPKMEQLFQFLWGTGVNSPYPVKCLYPAVQSGATDWKDYFITNFLNLPDHYHNGGIWPFVGGLWVRFLAHIGRTELAHQELARLAEACRQGIYGEWEFNEWLHGQTGRPMGKAHQTWSAASYIAAYEALHHSGVPANFAPLTEEMFTSKSESYEEENTLALAKKDL